MQMTRPRWQFFALWVSAWAFLSSLWCVTSARRLGATFDEPVYLTEGLQRWRSGSTAGLMKLGTMPLPVDVQTLPLYLWERWHGTPIDPVADFHKVLPWARAATLLFWWLLLVHAWLAARWLGGPWAGALAVAFLACEPCLASHAALATTDIAVAACLLALAYHFRANRDGRWWRRVAWPGLWFGLAVLAKASGLVFGGLCLLVLEGERCGWWRKQRFEIADCRLQIEKVNLQSQIFNLKSSLWDLFQIGLLGMVLVFVYCGSDWEPQRSFVAWAHGLPKGSSKAILVWLAKHLRIFSNAGEGLVRQVTHNLRGHGSYLLGQSDRRALWYYFPVALSIKLTVPLLLAPVVLAVLNWRRRNGQPWYGNGPLLCALVLLLFSLTCRVQIGVRFMFPLIALAVVGLSAVLVRTIHAADSVWGRQTLAVATLACLAWTASSAVAVWPNGMCYVNPLWGGTADGYRLVSEANYDWGQGLKELARWQRKHPGGELTLWYFGTDPALRTLPVRTMPLQTLTIQSAQDVLHHLRGQRVAVSTTLVYGCILAPSQQYVQAVLHARRPVARTTTFLIYDFTNETNARRAEPAAQASY
ncbi:MAG: glycosyltransferase family 39 protein [Planctomycetes bacterium]|nr:glycosyltransferase family 39 protein [Planctomycetota bacterium]